MDIIKPDNLDELKGSIPLQEYESAIVETDRFSFEEINPILLGLYGEVGSIMAASKKYHREKKLIQATKRHSKKSLVMCSGIFLLYVGV